MISILLVISTLACAALIHGLITFFYRYFRLYHIPGPQPLPLIGNIYQISNFGKLHKHYKEWSKIYGDVFVFWAFNTPHIIIMKGSVAREVLCKSDVFVKGWQYDRVLDNLFKDGLVTSKGERYKKDKALLIKYFTPKNIKRYVPDFIRNTKFLMEKHLDSSTNETSVDVSKFFLHLTLRNFFCFAFDFDAEKHSKELRTELTKEDIDDLVRLTSRGSKIIGQCMFLDLPISTLINPWMRELHREIPRLNAFLEDVSDWHLERESKGIILDNCLDAMLKSGHSRKDLYGQFMTIISAGHDTTGYFQAYTALLLARHPDVQKRVKDELCEVLKGETITEDNINKLQYLHCVFKESLRYYGIVPFLPRLANRETKLGNFKIPSKSNLILAFANMSFDDEVWSDVWTFNPDRFQDVPSLQSASRGYFPFAYGQRVCIGMNVAYIQSVVAFSMLLQKYTFVEDKSFRPKFTLSLSLTTTNGVQVYLKQDKE